MITHSSEWVCVCVYVFSRSVPHSPFAFMSNIFTISCVLRLASAADLCEDARCGRDHSQLTMYQRSSIRCKQWRHFPFCVRVPVFFVKCEWSTMCTIDLLISFFSCIQYTNGTAQSKQIERSKGDFFKFRFCMYAAARPRIQIHDLFYARTQTHASTSVTVQNEMNYSIHHAEHVFTKFKIGFYLYEL